MRGNLFFVVVAGFCFGIAIRTLYVLPVGVIFPCLILVAFFLGWWFFEKRTYQLVCALVVVSSIVGGVRASFVRTTIPNEFAQSINTTVSLEGIVATPPDVREKNIRLTVEVRKNTEKENASTRIISTVPLNSHILLGEDVQVTGKLHIPEPFATDGGRMFAYDKFLAKDGVFAVMPYATVKVLKPPSYKFWIWGALVAINNFTQRAIQHAIPAPYSGLSVGLLLGGKQGLSEELLNAFTIAGLLQIVVLSGYNVTIVADVILRASKNVPKGVGFIFAALGVCAFVAAAGAGSSAVRAALMSVFSLTARAINRTYAVVRALCVSLIFMLLYNPLLLVYDPGFQLSFLATLGLVIGSPHIEATLSWIKNDGIRGIAATTCAAQIAVLPILLYQSGNLSLVAIPANMLIAPLVPFAMALSAIAAGGSVIMPAFAPYIGVPAYVSLWWIVEIAKVAAAIPFANIIIPAFPFWVVMLVYGLLSVPLLYMKKQNKNLSHL